MDADRLILFFLEAQDFCIPVHQHFQCRGLHQMCIRDRSNMGSLMILLVLALAGGGAALYYFKFRKPKADTTGHDDLDEYDFGEDEDADEEPAEIEIHSEDGQEDET